MKETTLRGLVWIICLEATVAGCVIETDLARRGAPANALGDAASLCSADGALCAADADLEAEPDAGVVTDGMAGGMDGSMKCDGHDCGVASPGDGASPMMDW